MKRIGIVTLTGQFNFGNRLQNYAVQEVLSSLGADCITLPIGNDEPSRFQKLRDDFLHPRRLLAKAYRVLFAGLSSKSRRRLENRKAKFIAFDRQNLKRAPYMLTPRNMALPQLKDFDAFVTGSDQVWYLRQERLKLTFLTFAPPRKRVSYAASFGVSELPDALMPIYREYLNSMHRISVREDEGADIVQSLTSQRPAVLLDPTMAVGPEHWAALCRKPDFALDAPYILNFFLGEVSAEHRRFLDRLSDETKMKVIDISSKGDPGFQEIGPSEFLYLIKSSALVLTDSFHGTVFAIHFERPFFVYQRKGKEPSMYSRLDTLLRKFSFENRAAEFIPSTDDLFTLGFDHVPPILQGEQSLTRAFLREALGLTGNQGA